MPTFIHTIDCEMSRIDASFTCTCGAKPDYPAWICSPCGQKFGSRVPTCATYHYGECGWCGSVGVPVTEPRDYAWPKAPGVAVTRSSRASAGEGR